VELKEKVENVNKSGNVVSGYISMNISYLYIWKLPEKGEKI
jgi:hypothetical protein